ANSSDNFVKRMRRQAILQSLQLAPKFGRQEIRQDADQLSDFDEQSAGTDDRVPDPSGVCPMTLDETRVVILRRQKRPARADSRIAHQDACRSRVNAKMSEPRRRHL